MCKVIQGIFVTTFLLLFTTNIASALLPDTQTQVLLPGTSIPKFVEQLPVAGDITVVNATPSVMLGIPSTPSYNIHMREFQAQILPVSLGLGPTWVWGYLTDGDVAAQPAVRPSYLGPVVVAQRETPAYPTYSNELPAGNVSNVQQLLPIDMTIDWANPTGINCAPDPITGDYTNLQCGTLPPYLGPLPDAVHFHGAEVAPAFDGGPDAWFTQDNAQTGIGFPGSTYTYPNGQQEATLWFHPHGLGITRLNVYAGLAGGYILIDPDNPPLAAMPAFPQHDIPLIIQDRSFDTTGQLFYNLASNPQPNPTVHPFWIPEFIGDAIVVNGKTWPNLNVEPRQYRFRLLNGSNARFYDLSMNKGVKFIAIATDNGYLVNAVLTPNVVIGPGERYEVIVDFSALRVGTKVVMKNVARTPFPGGARPTRNGTDTIMQFTVVANASGLPNTTIANGTPIRPTPLEPIATGFVAGTNITRQLTLNEVIGAGGPLELVINNSKFNLLLNTSGCPAGSPPGSAAGVCRETELPAVGDTEIWEIINITADAHPMHTHLVSYQILDRTPFRATPWINQYDALLVGNGVLPGAGPPNPYSMKNADGAIGGNPPINSLLNIGMRKLPLPYEMGWKDTAIMYPGEVTRIAIRWAPQDAPVTGAPLCAVPTPPGTLPTSCVPQAGSNTYPFNPTELINGVGYVWHCHILDHEDNEMMRNYTVMPTRQPTF
ncbi:MAG: bilirubin oxidase [Deltaproteobacteria bacterium]|nr:bilirubin oxidase [Deltaproteobacteria bacterium]TLN01711.1 MAG: bilirubin oxidase [bacterium]